MRWHGEAKERPSRGAQGSFESDEHICYLDCGDGS